MKKKVFIIGITGQDGSLLAEKFLDAGYEVHGTGTKKAEEYYPERPWLRDLLKKIKYEICCFEEEEKLNTLLSSDNYEIIYFLGSQSNIGQSWKVPVQTVEVNGSFIYKTLNFLYQNQFKNKIVVALSGDAFDASDRIDENSRLLPDNPYSLGKTIATHSVRFFRDYCEMNVSGAILFMHESYRRPLKFFTQKVVNGVLDISEKKSNGLTLGNLKVNRDFISAHDVVNALYLMGETNKAATDYVISSGRYEALEKILEIIFSLKGLKFEEYVSIDQSFIRKNDKEYLWGNPSKIKKELNWEAKQSMEDCFREMLEYAEQLRRQ